MNRIHLYLGDARLYESEGSNVGFLNVDERTEAMFVLYLYHPMEVLADYGRFGGVFPEPTTYQEAEDIVLREELRNTEWEVSNHHLWMTENPLSLLRDENTRDELADRRLASGHMNPTAWVNLGL